MMTVRHLPTVLAACALSACGANTAYLGAPRTAGESATLVTVDTTIEEIDGHEVEPIRSRNLQVSLPPGPHVVWLRLHKTSPWWGRPTLTSGHKELCLVTEPGARYSMKGLPAAEESAWTVVVTQKHGGEVGTDCSYDRLFAHPPPGPLSAAEPPSGSAATNAISLELPPPPPGVPSAAPAVVARWRGHPLWRPPALPIVDVIFNVRTRLAVNPDRAAWAPEGPARYARSAAGVGLQLTPLWLFRDRVGVGVGSELELKGLRTPAPDAGLPFWRMPVTTTVHTLVRVHEDLVLLAGGVESHSAAQATGSAAAGTVTRSYSTRWGWVAKVGAYRRLSDVVAMTIALGYSHLDDMGAGASTLNVWLGLHASMQRPLRASDVP